eukprot:gene28846-biopygen32746
MFDSLLRRFLLKLVLLINVFLNLLVVTVRNYGTAELTILVIPVIGLISCAKAYATADVEKLGIMSSVNLSMIKDLAKLDYENYEEWLFNVIPALRLANLGNHVVPSAVPAVAQWLQRRVTAGSTSRQQAGAPSTMRSMWTRAGGVNPGRPFHRSISPPRGSAHAGGAGPSASSVTAGVLAAGGSVSMRTFGPTGSSGRPTPADLEERARNEPLPEDSSEVSSVTGIAGEEGGGEPGIDAENAARRSWVNPLAGKTSASAVLKWDLRGDPDLIPLTEEEMDRNVEAYRVELNQQMSKLQRLKQASRTPLPPVDFHFPDRVSDAEAIRALDGAEARLRLHDGSDVWVSNEEKAFSYMLLTMSKELQEVFRHYGSCQEIYDEVESWAVQHARRLGPKLVADLRAVQMTYSESPTTYFNRVKRHSKPEAAV